MLKVQSWELKHLYFQHSTYRSFSLNIKYASLNSFFKPENTMFQLESLYQPSGDQPQAIQQIMEWFSAQEKEITLLGATGTGKTFTMANVIQQLGKPTLVLSHNKTLAAQLATEFKYFFPNNAVHYFVSYFDYYQPESYLPERGIYIEKEATINKQIEMYRLATMASLLSREDVIVVSSVSALYGLWTRETFGQNRLFLATGQQYHLDDLKAQLIHMQYKPATGALEPGMFDLRGEVVDIHASTEKVIYRIIFNDTTLEMIQVKDAVTYKLLGSYEHITIWPATQYLQDMQQLSEIIPQIYAELKERVAYFKKVWLLAEAQRLEKRVSYDMKMMQETWFVNGIENYSPYFEKRLDGSPPNTLFDYFPDDFLLIIDESHMSVPQLGAMPRADTSRKQTLIDHGFRLPSAIHHRPINFDELSVMLNRKQYNATHVHEDMQKRIKRDAKTLYVSATPASYELEQSQRVVQQIIRPTGLLDPITYVYPKSGEYDSLYTSIEKLVEKDPSLRVLLEGYEEKLHTDLFR